MILSGDVAGISKGINLIQNDRFFKDANYLTLEQNEKLNLITKPMFINSLCLTRNKISLFIFFNYFAINCIIDSCDSHSNSKLYFQSEYSEYFDW